MSWYGKSIHQSLFGKGQDGVVTISVNTTLTSDMYYQSLVVNAGVTVTTGNYRIFANSFIEINGVVENNGKAGAVPTGATATVTGTLQAGAAGGNGQAGAGSVGGSNTSSICSSGGKGGNGGTGAGGSGGAITLVANNLGGPNPWRNAIQANVGTGLNTNVRVGTGTGGGGGGGGGGLAGGGGGSGGGIVFIAAPKIFGTGSIQANGGNGANATNANTGGGGGGGAGNIILISCNQVSSTSLTYSATGGTGGTGNGIGTAGSNGGSTSVPVAIKVSL